MNKNAKLGLYAAGGLGGFLVAYVTFALMMGAAPHQIPVVGAVFPQPQEKAKETPAPRAEVASTPSTAPTRTETRTVSAGLMDVFQIESPYASGELQGLADELKRKSAELDTRLAEVAKREQAMQLRSEQLDEHSAELQQLRQSLEERERDLAGREATATESDRSRFEREQQGWVKLAKLFADGDATELGARLAEYAPGDAARILQALKPARAKELLENVGAAKWREYADAYRLLETSARD